MNSLIESLNLLFEFEKCSNLTELDLPYQEVVTELDKLWKQIVIFEKNGYTRSDILEILSPIRAIFQKSPLGWRMQTLSPDYPGNYEIIEYICDAINRVPNNTIEYYCEEYALSCPATQQYRNLVQYQALQILETFRIAPKNPRVLSLSCSSCRDIWSIQIFLKELLNGEIVLIDRDIKALEFARTRLNSLEGKLQYIQGNVIQAVYKLESTEGFDLVVAGGLFDYLTKPVVKYLIKHIYYYLLKPNGKLIFTNIVKGNPYRPFMEYFGNLTLVERDEEDILDICQQLGLNQQVITLTKDEDNLRLIVEINK
jgi:SAM-dependent methyltransferase